MRAFPVLAVAFFLVLATNVLSGCTAAPPPGGVKGEWRVAPQPVKVVDANGTAHDALEAELTGGPRLSVPTPGGLKPLLVRRADDGRHVLITSGELPRGAVVKGVLDPAALVYGPVSTLNRGLVVARPAAMTDGRPLYEYVLVVNNVVE